MVALGSVLSKLAVTAVASGYWGSINIGQCDLSGARIPLTDAQAAALGQPNTSYPTAVGVAFGVQNYTCAKDNTFT